MSRGLVEELTPCFASHRKRHSSGVEDWSAPIISISTLNSSSPRARLSDAIRSRSPGDSATPGGDTRITYSHPPRPWPSWARTSPTPRPSRRPGQRRGSTRRRPPCRSRRPGGCPPGVLG
uniref:Uncharacterized protein n=1 Tax=Setaria viridis TaxID=4556 RepID=A0A4U6ULB0_SETVI|nr:hypothetical protein SEVIR_5G250800v2 [Setaria viridis]